MLFAFAMCSDGVAILPCCAFVCVFIVHWSGLTFSTMCNPQFVVPCFAIRRCVRILSRPPSILTHIGYYWLWTWLCLYTKLNESARVNSGDKLTKHPDPKIALSVSCLILSGTLTAGVYQIFGGVQCVERIVQIFMCVIRCVLIVQTQTLKETSLFVWVLLYVYLHMQCNAVCIELSNVYNFWFGLSMNDVRTFSFL